MYSVGAFGYFGALQYYEGWFGVAQNHSPMRERERLTNYQKIYADIPAATFFSISTFNDIWI